MNAKRNTDWPAAGEMSNRERNALSISVIGCRYLGFLHAACIASLGHNLVGFDIESNDIGDSQTLSVATQMSRGALACSSPTRRRSTMLLHDGRAFDSQRRSSRLLVELCCSICSPSGTSTSCLNLHTSHRSFASDGSWVAETLSTRPNSERLARRTGRWASARREESEMDR
jgi:hypothetical protein